LNLLINDWFKTTTFQGTADEHLQSTVPFWGGNLEMGAVSYCVAN